MDGNLAPSNSIPRASYGFTDLQGSVHTLQHQSPNPSFHHLSHHSSHCQHQGSMTHPSIHDAFSPQISHMKDCNHQPSQPTMNHDKGGCRFKNSASDDDDLSLNTEEGITFKIEAVKEKIGSPWQRIKWTDSMVRLLMTAVSYLGDDALPDCSSSGRRKAFIVQKKGKWKLISKVLAERGFYVSPQQCEDKFNDLNKRYKRLTDILGRGTSCKVVENPALLDLMHHISDKAKDDARKILSSKHLFYEEMCSYHNGNRLNLPANPSLQRSLQSAILGKDYYGTKRAVHGEYDKDDQGDSEDGEEDDSMLPRDMDGSCFHKRVKLGMDHEEMNSSNLLGSNEFNSTNPLAAAMEMNHVLSEAPMQTEVLRSHSIQLEEQSLHIKSQMLELDQQEFKWQCLRKKKDKELEKMRMENERIKLENERLVIELKLKELNLGLS